MKMAVEKIKFFVCQASTESTQTRLLQSVQLKYCFIKIVFVQTFEESPPKYFKIYLFSGIQFFQHIKKNIIKYFGQSLFLTPTYDTK
jgi:hypothetical protein